jgi:hypothetical protein
LLPRRPRDPHDYDDRRWIKDVGLNGRVEFGALEIDAASRYLRDLPLEMRRVQIEVWEDRGWRFVYGDERSRVAEVLESVVRGRRFRLRPMTDSLADGAYMPLISWRMEESA